MFAKGQFPVKALAICALYGGLSLSMGLINKTVLSVYNFRCVSIITLTQLAFSCVVLFCLRSAALINSFPDIDMDIVSKVWPLSLLFVANLYVGLAGLSYISVPMFSVLRRLATIFVLGGEYFLLKKVASVPVRYTLAFNALGAIVAGWADVTFNAVGYALVLCNNVTTTMYLITVKKLNIPTNALLYYNSVIALPVLIVIVILTGEWQTIQTFEHINNPMFQLGFLASSTLGLLLNYAMFLCTTHNSPLATSVTGNIKDVLSTVLGMLFFSDFIFNWYIFAGLAISLGSSMVYSYIKLQENMAYQEAAAHSSSSKV